MGSHLSYIADCDVCTVCAVGKAFSWLTPRKPSTPPLMRLFTSCTEISWAHSNRRLMEDTSVDHGPVYHVDGRLPSLQQTRSFVSSAVDHFNRDTPRQTHHQMACRQGRQIYGRQVQGLLPETGTTQELVATNTPQQIDASERVGRTLCGMVRCILVDNGFSPFLWGELMMTASYFWNRIPHSALKMETAYKMLCCKDSDLSHESVCPYQGRQQARSHVVGRNGVRFQPEREQLIPYLEPQDPSSCRKRERRLHRNATALASPFQATFAFTGTGSSNV